jgi:hypothetical protein
VREEGVEATLTRGTFGAIERDEGNYVRDPRPRFRCHSRGRVWREDHQYDKDDVCIFCDQTRSGYHPRRPVSIKKLLPEGAAEAARR